MAKARELGIDPATWVFPHAGTEAHDTDAIAARGRLDRSPAIRIGAREALAAAGLGIGDIEFIDIYSCFPSAVAVAAAEIGLPLDDPARPLTCTGADLRRWAVEQLQHPCHRDGDDAFAGKSGFVRAGDGQQWLPHQTCLRDLRRHAAGGAVRTPGRPGTRRRRAGGHRAGLVRGCGPHRILDRGVRTGRAAREGFRGRRPRDGERALAVVTGADDVAVLAAEDVAGRSVTIGEDGGAVLGCSN